MKEKALAEKPAGCELTDERDGRQASRLMTLVLLAVVVFAAAQHFIGLAQNPLYQVHSDDLVWMYRFQHLPYAAAPGDDPEHTHGLDQPALERYVFHFLLKWTGRLPADKLPEWDYNQDFNWNVSQGRVAPPDAVHFVRVVNAAFMIAAAVLIFLALAKAVSPLAGFVGGLYFTVHPATVDVTWSIGSDPLLWMLMPAALLIWLYRGKSLGGAIAVGIVTGLAASAKINGGVVVVGYCAWVLLKRRPLLAVAAGTAALVTFVALNPVVFGRGILGVPASLNEILTWRHTRSLQMAAHYQGYADAPRWRLFYYLLGPWWPLLALILVSPRLWRLEPVVFWAAALTILHALTVTAPLPRYKLPIDAGLVLGVIAAYWPCELPVKWPWRRGPSAGGPPDSVGEAPPAAREAKK